MIEDVSVAHEILESPAAAKQSLRWRRFAGVFFALVGCAALLAAQSPKRASSGGGEEFFIISSVDIAKKQLLVKEPTEITELLQVNDKTRYTDRNGKPIQLGDLRAGDTVYIRMGPASSAKVAIAIRRGPMTVEELRRRYLKQ